MEHWIICNAFQYFVLVYVLSVLFFLVCSVPTIFSLFVEISNKHSIIIIANIVVVVVVEIVAEIFRKQCIDRFRIAINIEPEIWVQLSTSCRLNNKTDKWVAVVETAQQIYIISFFCSICVNETCFEKMHRRHSAKINCKNTSKCSPRIKDDCWIRK